jgi:hypothetical protein
MNPASLAEISLSKAASRQSSYAAPDVYQQLHYKTSRCVRFKCLGENDGAFQIEEV